MTQDNSAGIESNLQNVPEDSELGKLFVKSDKEVLVSMNESGIASQEILETRTEAEKAKLQVWPEFRRPPYMTDVHALVLKELWPEVKYPTEMRDELLTLFTELKPHEARNIVAYWMWTIELVDKKGKTV